MKWFLLIFGLAFGLVGCSDSPSPLEEYAEAACGGVENIEPPPGAEEFHEYRADLLSGDESRVSDALWNEASIVDRMSDHLRDALVASGCVFGPAE